MPTSAIANVTVVEAGFLSYPHTGEPVDFVYTRNALHHLPDFWKAVALDRIAAVLRPGGILRLHDLVFDFTPGEAATRIEAWISGAVDDPAVGWTAAELAEHVGGEFSTYSWLLDVMLERSGFEVVERTFRRSAYGAYTCARTRRLKQGSVQPAESRLSSAEPSEHATVWLSRHAVRDPASAASCAVAWSVTAAEPPQTSRRAHTVGSGTTS